MMKKHVLLPTILMVTLTSWADNTPCPTDYQSNAQVIYGQATISHSDSLTAIDQAVTAAKEQIHQQLTKQLKHVTVTYVQGYNSPDSYNDVLKALTRITAAADRVMDKTTTECIYTSFDEESLYQASAVEQLKVDILFQYIAENYNDRILNMDRFIDIYTSHLQYQ